ncbi:cytochrome P450 4C1-like [Cydia splendana]|uniref:cytochrome P450 4C1-like n=1 Tax=Cydia splendana TaxID=1100963 RepID=UPI00300D725D
MIWQLLLVALALGAAYYRWSRRRLYKLAAEIPCLPDSYPVIGHAHIFAGSNEDIMQQLQNLGRISNDHDGLTSFWVANRLLVSMTDPKAIEVVSKACLDKDEFLIKYIRTAIGNGSIFAPVNIWHPRRKINAPFFSRKNLDQLMPVFDAKSSIMADLLRAEAGGGDFPIWRYVTTFTFDTVCETALNVPINTQKDSEHYYLLNAIDGCTQVLAKRVLQPWLHPDIVFKKNNNNELSHFIEAVIQSSGGLEKGYSDMELREELMVFMVAGSDTSATAVSYTTVLLSRYPDVQDKVYQELQEVFGESDRAVTPEDLPKLTYLEAVIKESLRLYPPVPVVVREVHEDILLPSGTTLVVETTVMFNIWGTHRNTAYWGRDAEEFRPERFLQGPLPHPAMFVPFSYSVRNCLGATYAMMSAKTALVNLIRRYRLLPPAGVRAADLQRPLPVKFDIMMKAVDNFTLRIEERNRKPLMMQAKWQKALIDNAQSPAERARLLAVSEPESGLWLHALPSPNIGTLLERTTLALATSLRLGVKTNEPHRCRCGSIVDELGHHGLSCQRSAGRISRHASLNDVIRRALASVSVPAILEPNGIARDDGKRPDGMTLIPWRLGRTLVWDATCVDTLAPSHLQATSVKAGAAATTAEQNKRRKYAVLSEGYIFAPFGVETLGPWGPSAKSLFKEISQRLIDTSGDRRAGSYLGQRISLAIQKAKLLARIS